VQRVSDPERLSENHYIGHGERGVQTLRGQPFDLS